MKKLLLIRHAKSDWGDPSLDDIDRPLNERGKRDAPMMAQRLLDKKVRIDAFISSPAKRAFKTAKIMAEEFKAGKDSVQTEKALYLAGEESFLKVITHADDDCDCIAIFSHNPGITEFANELTDTRIDNIPTCGVFAVQADCDRWKDFEEAKKQLLFFTYPKENS
jgi:phosphohistidine phosphatase